MNKKYALLISGVAALLLSGALFAAQNKQNGSGKSAMDKLEEDGYSCEKVVAGFFTCTKDGENDYYCTDRNRCEEVPGTAILRPSNSLKNGVLKGGAILRNNAVK